MKTPSHYIGRSGSSLCGEQGGASAVQEGATSCVRCLAIIKAEPTREAQRLADMVFEKAQRHTPVLDDVQEERLRQDAKWGEQNHPDLSSSAKGLAPEVVLDAWGILTPASYRRAYEMEVEDGETNWATILLEEAAEVVEQAALGDRTRTREELVQLAAVCVAWIEAIDRRK